MQKIYKVNKCPLIKQSYSECYYNSLNSQGIECAIYYCCENFEQCDTYKTRMNETASGGTSIQADAMEAGT